MWHKLIEYTGQVLAIVKLINMPNLPKLFVEVNVIQVCR